MKRFWKKYYRAIIIIMCLLAVCTVVFISYENSTKLTLPDCEFEYDSGTYKTTYEMDDYILTEENDGYKIVHKQTGAKRQFLNDPFEDDHNMIYSVQTYQNKVYYGVDGHGFYCYDADKDLTTVLYEDLMLRLQHYVITLFDIVVFNTAVTRTEIETHISHYFIYDGELIIVSDRNIAAYNGKSERELLKGGYNVDRFKDGVMELSTYAKDSEGRDIRTKYRYEMETGELVKLDE